MLRHIAVLIVCGVAALTYGLHTRGSVTGTSTFISVKKAPVAEEQNAKPQPVRLSGVERVRRDQQGHYVGDFRLNNFRVKGLIDTGATTIAINESVARRAGLRLRRDDFKYQVNTANGAVVAARATINDVQIGQIRVSAVEAMVLPDETLNVVLVGMSFMNRLRGFEYDNGQLVLRR
ncbi:MAG: TIGR02281 family clan AA aspartic protease [Pseudomonadota bacterium]